MRSKLRVMGSKRSRAKTLALLCLMAHALFVCFTHFHDAGQSRQSSATANVQASGGNPHGAPDSTGDSHCLSCRLQRNFVSDTHTSSVIVEPIREPLNREIFLSAPHSRGLSLLIYGRGPPLL
ncbi:MAG TPA: hypothetical protein VNI02_22630 [Blastocatellia bacterium]|nr:hypothetical protein [Blastocatellia bacterium]